MIDVNQNIGLSGEFQVIVRRTDGSIKLDTGMQPNLILDNGLKVLLGVPQTASANIEYTGPSSTDLMADCIIGTGNNTPNTSDITLQQFVKKSSSTRNWESGVEQPTTDLHDGFVKLWKQGTFIFDGINNQNISEVGLISFYGPIYQGGQTYPNNYILTTRALIKDTQGSPITITVLQDEVLEINYRINMYVDIRRKSGTFTLTTTKDRQNTTAEYDYFMQPHSIGAGNYISLQVDFFGANRHFNSHGVKEADTELTSAYDLNDTVYQGLTHTDLSGLDSKVDGYKSAHYDGDPYSDYYRTIEITERSFDTKRIGIKVTNGVYSHIYPNGIRAFSVHATQDVNNLVSGLVVVKNKANGQGIKKTNRQKWEVNFTCTIDRWGG